ncbi:GntR family transcriptional regulator [Sagittula sp. NFXS13]
MQTTKRLGARYKVQLWDRPNGPDEKDPQMPEDAFGPRRSPLFQSTADILRRNIDSGTLTPGLVLQESALSERLSVSRATVKRALSLLADEGLLCRFDGRGYLVAGRDSPRRLDLRSIELDLDQLDEDAGKPNWQRLQEEMEADLARCLIFGRYRIIEALVAEHFGVSRTVVRDVLGRLQERGLVTKSNTSRWVVEPLTAQRFRNKFELASILEVAALETAMPDVEALGRLSADIRALPQDGPDDPDIWFDLEGRFYDLAILSTPNADLAGYVRSNRAALRSSQKVLFSLGLPPDRQTLSEHGMVVDLILAQTRSAAASMLSTHLGNALNRTIAQLKIVSVLDPPDDLAPYLQAG